MFNRSRGLALETVDGGLLEDVTISNITMREISNAPIFLRLASRMRGPAGTPVGKLRRVSISNVIVYDADPRYRVDRSSASRDNPVEDIRLSNIRILLVAAGSRWRRPHRSRRALVNNFFRPPGGTGPREPYAVPEREAMYPEPSMFGVLPAYGFYVRHAAGIRMDGVEVGFMSPDTRPAFVLDDVRDVELPSRARAERRRTCPPSCFATSRSSASTHSQPCPTRT